MIERGKCTQLEVVRWLMSDGEWWGLERLTQGCRDFIGCTETAASARVRDLRNKLGLEVESQPLRQGSRQLKHRLILGADRSESPNRQGDSAGSGSAPDLPVQPKSPPQQRVLFGSGEGTPQDPAPPFFREYPD